MPSKTEQKKSGSLTTSENIGPEVPARNLVVSGDFEARPPNSVEQHFVPEPVRNVLLADRPLERSAETLRQGDLAATSQGDRASKRSNVRFLHDHALYTNRFVSVNEPVCMTDNKPACTVLQMRSTSRKNAGQPRSNKRVAIAGADGKTLGQRVSEAMAYASGRRGTAYIQKDLVHDVNKIVLLVEGEAEAVFSQAMASAIMNNKVTRSTFTPYIAKACHVDAVWLAHGSGQMIPKG